MTDRDADDSPARSPDDEAPIASTTCEMGDLLLFADRLSFRGSPLQERLGRGHPDRDVALRRVTSIEWQKPSFFRMGRLGVVLEPQPGGDPATVSFPFQTWERKAFEAFRDALERGVADARARANEAPGETSVAASATGDAAPATSLTRAAAAASATSPAAAGDVPGQIRRLAELRDEGLLTADEFEAKKRELLARM